MTLQGSEYHFALIDDPNLKKGEITITPAAVCLPLSKQIHSIEPSGLIGVDINERNITTSSTDGLTNSYDISRVPRIQETYRRIRSKIARLKGSDHRITSELLSKYGKRERARIGAVLHDVSKSIVEESTHKRMGLVLENLRGIRKNFARDRPVSTSLRGRMNAWPFYSFRRMVEYKAAWVGVPVLVVNPRGTSSNCPDCGSRVASLPKRQLYCGSCDKTWDRDVLASKNIMACAVPQALPPRRSDEKERGGDGSNPSSRWGEVESSRGKRWFNGTCNSGTGSRR
ncbi:MAG: transposase [Thaumarchaeota archaeon]|nr:transposase [Nitrososphaerota archaeon]